MHLLAETATAGIWTRAPEPRATERTAPEWVVKAARWAMATAAVVVVGRRWRRRRPTAAAERASQRTWLRRPRSTSSRCSGFGHDGTAGW